MAEDVRWDPPAGGEWPAGWYLLEGEVEAGGNARVLRVELVESPSRRVVTVPVAPSRDGHVSSVVPLSRAASQARLLAGEADGFDGEGLRLRRIGRGEAALRMLGGLRRANGARDYPRIVGTAFALVLAVLRSGIERAGELWVGRYLWSAGHGRVAVRGRVRHGAWRGTRPALLEAIDQLRVVAQDHGVVRWQSTGNDPKFRLSTIEGQPLPLAAGWYHLRAQAEVSAGRLIDPCLYPDFGGFSGDGMISLPDPDRSGRIDALVMLPRPALQLRFDPSTQVAAFALTGFELRRVGRLGALASMLGGLRRPDGRRDLAAMARAAAGFVGTATRYGVSKAATELFALQDQLRRHGQRSYPSWVRRYDTIGSLEMADFRARLERLPARPQISLVVPVYDTPEQWLRRCLDSVLAQVYPDWELCIAEDASPTPRVREVLREYEARDPRIRVTYREVNGHIAQASNTALDMVRGQYVGLLDHDDELRPHSLLEVAEALAADPAIELVYSDEDKIDERGRRFHPNFKPDWNPDLLLSQNYVCHFTVVRTARVRAVGGFRQGFEGSQDHDLILRCTAGLAPEQVHHIPKVLYHWRAIEGSTALAREAKDYAGDAGCRAVADHVRAVDPAAQVEQLPHGHYRVRWSIPSPAPKVSLIVPTRDRVDLLRKCVESVLEKTHYPDFEVLVVDNRSSEPEALAYLESLRGRERVRVLAYDAPFNYSAINNMAAAQCHGRVLGLINNDIEVIAEDWLDELVGHALRKDVGAVGAMLYYPDRTIQHAGVILGLGGIANHAYVGQPAGSPGHGARAKVAQNLSAVTAACMVVRREVYEEVGGLDEAFEVAFNDIDFCLRLLARGYRNVWTPFAELYHHESASRGRDDSAEKARRFRSEVRRMERRWGAFLHADPAYNPNMSLEIPGFELAQPPREAGLGPRPVPAEVDGAAGGEDDEVADRHP